MNIFGFLGNPHSPASLALMDRRLAVEWVRDNIENFGGNPDNVTIFGESGGGRKVSVLNAMGMAEGLFDRAIVQSGSMLSFRTPEQAHKDTLDFFKAVEIEDGDIDALKALSQDEIIAGLRKAAAMSM